MLGQGPYQFGGPLPGWGLVLGQDLHRMVTVLSWRKSPIEHRLATRASFKRVTSITRSGPHLVKNISERDPPTWKAIPSSWPHLGKSINRGWGCEGGGWQYWEEERYTREKRGTIKKVWGRWVGFQRFSYCRKFHTYPSKQENWKPDSKIHIVL